MTRINPDFTEWKLPIAEDLITGKDGEVRAAHIRTSNCSTTRLVSRLYPLEEHSDESGKAVTNSAQEESQHSADSAQQEDQEKTPMTGTRTRAAATKAISKIREWRSVLGYPQEDV